MHLMPAMGDFLNKNPNLKMDLRLSDSIVDMVEGGFDIAISNAALKDSTLIARKLVKDKQIVCASPSYLDSFGEPCSPQDLINHQCVNLVGMDLWQFEGANGLINVKAKGRFKTDNGEAMRQACVSGLGIAVNSTWSVSEALKAGDLVQIYLITLWFRILRFGRCTRALDY